MVAGYHFNEQDLSALFLELNATFDPALVKSYRRGTHYIIDTLDEVTDALIAGGAPLDLDLAPEIVEPRAIYYSFSVDGVKKHPRSYPAK